MPAVEIPVYAKLDKRSVESVGARAARELQEAVGGAGTKSGQDFAENFLKSYKIDAKAPNISEFGKAGDRAGKAFRDGIQNGISEATASLGAFGPAADKALNGLISRGGAAAVGIAGIGIAAVAVGKQLYDLGTTWDNVTDGIAARTGKVGSELDAITSSASRVAKGVALPLENIGEIAGQVAQSLHVTGAPLDAMTKQISTLAEVTGEAVDIRDLGKLYRVFAVDASEMPKVFDDLFRASTASGRGVNELVDAALKGAPALSAFGLSIGASTGLISLLEEAGVDADASVNAMTIALKKFADAGLEPQQALRDTVTQIKNLNDAGNQIGAIDLAQTTFGRGFAPIFEAIRSGNLDAAALSNTLTNQTGPSIGAMADATRDAAEQFQMLKNRVAVDFAPAAISTFESVNQLLNETLSILTDISAGDWGSVFSGIIDDVTGPFTSPDAPWRKWFPNQTPPAITDPRTGLPASQSNAPAGTRDSGGVPDFSIDPKTGLPRAQSTAPAGTRDSGGLPPGMIPPPPGTAGGPPLVLPTDKGGSASSSGAAPGPVVARPNTDPSSLLQGTPMSSQLYSSAASVLDAQYRVSQEQAELNSVMADVNSTAEDLTKARNELQQAQQDQFKAELSLAEQKQAATENLTKATESAHTSFEGLTAALDGDLGASKGLAGLADNLVRFLASLATAPLQGVLSQIASGGQSTGAVGMPQSASRSMQQMPQASQWAQSAQPYGLPGGTNTGGYGSSGEIFPPWVHQMEQAFGVKASTYPGHQADNRQEAGYAPNPTGQNRGIDWVGDVPNMQNLADYLATIPGAMEQVIWQNPNTGAATEIAGGRPQPGYFNGDLGGHQNHVHTRQSQGIPTPGLSPGLPPPGSVPTGGPLGTGFPTAMGPGGIPQSPAIAGPGGPLGVGQGIGAPQGGALGQGLGQASASYAPDTVSEAPDPNWTAQGGGGLSSGLIGMAMSAAGSAASMGANAFAPGSGQAAQMGAQMAQQAIERTIKFGSQAVGSLVGGAQESLTWRDPDSGEDPLANSWLTRLSGALMGAKPAGSIAAGKADQGSKTDPNAPKEQGNGQQPQGNTTIVNNTLNNGSQRDNPQQLLNDLGNMQQRAYE